MNDGLSYFAWDITSTASLIVRVSSLVVKTAPKLILFSKLYGGTASRLRVIGSAQFLQAPVVSLRHSFLFKSHWVHLVELQQLRQPTEQGSHLEVTEFKANKGPQLLQEAAKPWQVKQLASHFLQNPTPLVVSV